MGYIDRPVDWPQYALLEGVRGKIRRLELEINPTLYGLYEKTSHFKKNTGPIEKSENACKS
jgi:hypothetical protein